MALALSEPVWVEITDPESRNTFYANLVWFHSALFKKEMLATQYSSGECDWSLPEGAVIQRQNPSGEWWELFDDVHNLPYYYNTKTGQTDWERPQDSTNIISLTAIQSTNANSIRSTSTTTITTSSTAKSSNGMTSPITGNTTPLALSAPISTEASQAKPGLITADLPEKSVRNTSSFPKSPKNTEGTGTISPKSETSPPISPTSGSGFRDITNWRRNKNNNNNGSQQQQPPTPTTNSFVSTFQRAASMTLNRNSAATGIQPVAIPRPRSTTPNSAPLSALHPPVTLMVNGQESNGGGGNGGFLQPARKSFQIAERARKFGIGAPIANDEAARKMSPIIMEQQQEALRKMAVSPPPTSRPGDGSHVQVQPYHPQVGGRIFPPGTHPALPAELQDSISQFRIAGFAQKYFSTHKKGLFRRKVPMEKMLLHQKSPLTQPLMVLNKRGVQKDALRCFKIIQKLMGERKGNGYVGPTGVELGETCVDLSIQSEDDIKLVLELIKKGLDHGELRDEIYVQLCKQLTENPSREGSIKGWHLFTILLITFSPSKNLHDYLASFLNQHATSSLHPIPVMAQHCHDLLRRISKRGSRAKQLTLVEIARAQEAAFRPSVFEATLEKLMSRQMAAGGEWAAWRVPRLMVFLKESVVQLGGLKTEGIFRISGDLGSVAELRARIELGNYDIGAITDPHVPCSLLRLWIRDLPEPVIPYDLYQQCIQGSQDKDAVAKVIAQLPLWHKEMIVYLVSFLKTFNDPKVREATKMSLSNLAMVFAPTLLQCSSDDAPMLMGHLQAERAFVSTLISEVELSDEDLRIIGEETG
ncbi:hypothetical protein BGZ83_007932 [Gryganskiella cystojenkinii]|nr:hypothetical protein BGZ83_007932 [Gryganskiella cystojenkinii]